jgi:hypothetical protein
MTAPERHTDTARNKILNSALSDLDQIINGHDPETDTSINNIVWDRLDKLALEIEAKARADGRREGLMDAAALVGNRVGHHGTGLTNGCQCGMCTARREDHFCHPRPARRPGPMTTWTDDEILRALELHDAGWTFGQIADHLDRSRSSVASKIRQIQEANYIYERRR